MRLNSNSFHNDIPDTDFTVSGSMTTAHLYYLMQHYEGRIIINGCPDEINADGQMVIRVEITFKTYRMSLEAFLAGAAIVLIAIIVRYLIKRLLIVLRDALK